MAHEHFLRGQGLLSAAPIQRVIEALFKAREFSADPKVNSRLETAAQAIRKGGEHLTRAEKRGDVMQVANGEERVITFVGEGSSAWQKPGATFATYDRVGEDGSLGQSSSDPWTKVEGGTVIVSRPQALKYPEGHRFQGQDITGEWVEEVKDDKGTNTWVFKADEGNKGSQAISDTWGTTTDTARDRWGLEKEEVGAGSFRRYERGGRFVTALPREITPGTEVKDVNGKSRSVTSGDVVVFLTDAAGAEIREGGNTITSVRPLSGAIARETLVDWDKGGSELLTIQHYEDMIPGIKHRIAEYKRKVAGVKDPQTRDNIQNELIETLSFPLIQITGYKAIAKRLQNGDFPSLPSGVREGLEARINALDDEVESIKIFENSIRGPGEKLPQTEVPSN